MIGFVCGVREGCCVCYLPEGHDGPHECRDRIACNGAWDYRDDEFVIVRMPGGFG